MSRRCSGIVFKSNDCYVFNDSLFADGRFLKEKKCKTRLVVSRRRLRARSLCKRVRRRYRMVPKLDRQRVVCWMRWRSSPRASDRRRRENGAHQAPSAFNTTGGGRTFILKGSPRTGRCLKEVVSLMFYPPMFFHLYLCHGDFKGKSENNVFF